MNAMMSAISWSFSPSWPALSMSDLRILLTDLILLLGMIFVIPPVDETMKGSPLWKMRPWTSFPSLRMMRLPLNP